MDLLVLFIKSNNYYRNTKNRIAYYRSVYYTSV